MRRTQISECDPRWVRDAAGAIVGVSFECPEADGGCDSRHFVPNDRWTVAGELATLTIHPSLRCRGACQMHIVVTDGVIEFAGDSKSGPDWIKSDG